MRTKDNRWRHNRLRRSLSNQYNKQVVKDMKTRLIFVRHGEAEGNINRVFHGWTDSSLTSKGEDQARMVAKRLKDEEIDVIYSSPLKRAFETARNIAKESGIDDIKVDEGLKEIHGGEWENEPWDELPIKWPEEYHNWEHKPHLHCAPMGESMKGAFDRIIVSVNKIIQDNKGRNICIVTHGTVLRTLLCHYNNKPFEELATVTWHDNTSVTIIDIDEDEYEIIIEGDNSHLGHEFSTLAFQDWWKKEEDR